MTPADGAGRTTVAERLLVIKHGALGDFVQATGAFAAIRHHHAGGRITLLTTEPFVPLARDCPWFDEVWIDRRPGWPNLPGWWGLLSRIRRTGFSRIYDLQTSARTDRYFRLTGWPGRRPEWSGVAAGCSHPHANPARDRMHTVERLAEQLAYAGIASPPAPSVDWLDADIRRFALPSRYVLVVPGGSPHRPEKRWPAAHYTSLARAILHKGAAPVLIGGASEREITGAIAGSCSGAIDLGGATTLPELAALARRAAGAVGNDTGPVHLIATAGAPTVVLFSHASDPALCAPRGRAVAILRREPLSGLSVGEVEAALRLR